MGLGYCANAQEQSVKPGINDRFKDPDVEALIQTFEADGRAIYDNRNKIVSALKLKRGMEVADIGAGTGFFSRMIAEKVGKKGTVYAVEIAQGYLDHIEEAAAEEGLTNVKGVLATDRSSQLPAESVDVVFTCDTYHHFEFPYDTLESIHKALRPGGILVIVDFERIEGITDEWALGHVRCGKGTVTDEVKNAGFDFVKEVPVMEDQYLIKFRKRETEE
jgi:predicted methyltransferase